MYFPADSQLWDNVSPTSLKPHDVSATLKRSYSFARWHVAHYLSYQPVEKLDYPPLTSTHNLCFEQIYEKKSEFLSEIFHFFLVVNFSVYLNRLVFVMTVQYPSLTWIHVAVLLSEQYFFRLQIAIKTFALFHHSGEPHVGYTYLNLLDSPEVLQILMTLTTVVKPLLPNFLGRAIVILNFVRRFRNSIADTVPC